MVVAAVGGLFGAAIGSLVGLLLAIPLAVVDGGPLAILLSASVGTAIGAWIAPGLVFPRAAAPWTTLAPGPIAAPERAAEVPRREGALLGPGSLFTGTLVFTGDVRVDGRFSGRITTDGTIVVGDEATVTAEVACGRAIVLGAIDGTVRASESIELRAGARLEGDVVTPSLAIAAGAHFRGRSRMSEADAVPEIASDRA